MKSPLIIIGMHRSGTSLVAKVLEKAGIFMGVVKDHNYEAMHFLSLNQQTLWAAGGSWLKPVIPEKIHWKTFPKEELFCEHFRLNTKAQQILYQRFPRDWGWKDPRNTFTLPMWLSLFPDAKVLHVFRDEKEVLKSLQSRNLKKGEVFDERLVDEDFCQKLIKKYVKTARSYSKVSGLNYLEISYHKIVELDKPEILKLSDFSNKNTLPLFEKYVISKSETPS